MKPPIRHILVQADEHFSQHHDFSLIDHTVALFNTGSHAYGTSTPESDVDLTAVILPRMRHIVGLGGFEHYEPGVEGTADVKGMSLKKFVKLALDGNPNVIEMLFFEPEQWIYIAPQFRSFIEYRTAFLSREVYRRYAGYAKGQFHKMEAGKAQQFAGRKRKDLIATYGYDPKDASHLLRLLYNGTELAVGGTLTPRLTGTQLQTVLDVKAGKWKLDDIKAYADVLAEKAEGYFNGPDCPLPEKPDTDFVEILLMEAHRKAVA